MTRSIESLGSQPRLPARLGHRFQCLVQTNFLANVRMGKRILLTAADSFTGTWLKPALERRGHTVIGTSRRNPSTELMELDIGDPVAVRRCIDEARPDILIHLAGIAFANHSTNRNTYLANVIGALNLAQAFERIRSLPDHLVFVSSATVYSSAVDGEPITEDHPVDPHNHYSASKAMVEIALKQYMRDLPISIVRPFNYTGANQRDIFFPAKVAKCFRERDSELHVGNIDVVRDLSDVRDICEMYCRLAESESVGLLNFCSGKGIRMADIISECARLTGHEPNVIRDPRFIRGQEVPTLIGSTQRLEALLGPLQFRTLEATMRDMLRNPTNE